MMTILKQRAILMILAVGAVAIAGGCGGPAVSPTDQLLLRDADQLHARLASATLEGRNPKLSRYFEQLAARMTAAARELDQKGQIKSPVPEPAGEWMFGKNIAFHLLDSPRLSAFTSGGRHIYIYMGLFSQCQSEDELAAIFCQQYAHLYRRDVQQVLRRPAQPPNTENALLEPFVLMRLTPAQQRAADAMGFSIFVRAGWDPTRYATVCQRLAHGGAPSDAVDRGLLAQRVEDAKHWIDKLPETARDWAQAPVADDARLAQLQGELRSAASAAPVPQRTQWFLLAIGSSLRGGESPAELQARALLFPPAPPADENKWGKGLSGRTSP